jgi:hypothetical protein
VGITAGSREQPGRKSLWQETNNNNNNNNNNVEVFEPCSTIWRGIAKAAVVGMGLTWRGGEGTNAPPVFFLPKNRSFWLLRSREANNENWAHTGGILVYVS